VHSFFNKLHQLKSGLATKPPILQMISKPSNPHLFGKKILSISPGGYKGFYVFGICKYIKETYDLSDYVFSGASAGAWNSLVLCSKYNIDDVQNKILDPSLMQLRSANQLELTLKNRILKNYRTEDFELDRLFIGVTTLEKYKSNTVIYNGFENLEDAINCCIASSHIPFLTGGLTNVYRKTFSFDGGFSRYPYLNTTVPILHIHPNLLNHFSQNKSLFNISDYTTMFSKNNFPFETMIENGYLDAMRNKQYLDSIFEEKYLEI
jgi:hypothetical protein